MSSAAYLKASKYPNLDAIYAQCGGPGGLKLAEFLAEKMGLQPGKRVLDVGTSADSQLAASALGCKTHSTMDRQHHHRPGV